MEFITEMHVYWNPLPTNTLQVAARGMRTLHVKFLVARHICEAHTARWIQVFFYVFLALLGGEKVGWSQQEMLRRRTKTYQSSIRERCGDTSQALRNVEF